MYTREYYQQRREAMRREQRRERVDKVVDTIITVATAASVLVLVWFSLAVLWVAF